MEIWIEIGFHGKRRELGLIADLGVRNGEADEVKAEGEAINRSRTDLDRTSTNRLKRGFVEVIRTVRRVLEIYWHRNSVKINTTSQEEQVKLTFEVAANTFEAKN